MPKLKELFTRAKDYLKPRGHTDQFHSHEMTGKEADRLEAEAIRESGFIADEGPEARIFEGLIYEPGKVSTRIIKGMDKEGRPAVLKVQVLKPPREEAENMRDFERQKKPGSAIHTAKIYQHQAYSDEKRYGWMVMEHVEGKAVFEGLATEDEMEEWVKIYADYRQNCLNDAFFDAKWYEKPGRAAAATGLRIANWLNIARKQGHLNPEKVTRGSRHLIKMLLDGTDRISFTHGHFSSKDVKRTNEEKNYLFSQAFWKYLPEYYDSTFQIWASLKDLRGDQIPSPQQAIEYAEKWRKKYKTLEFIQADQEFDRYFASNMVERAVGALVVDIDADLDKILKKENVSDEEKNQAKRDAEKLRTMFRGVYEYYMRTKLPQK